MIAAERGASENTCLAYRRDLKDFTGWLAKRPHDVTDADSADIRDFLPHLRDAAWPRPAVRANCPHSGNFSNFYMVTVTATTPRQRSSTVRAKVAVFQKS